MCDSPLSVPAGRRSLPESVCGLLSRASGSWLLCLWLLAGLPLPAAAQTATLTVSPATSTDGAYTVSWSAPATTSIKTRLHEQVGSGAWAVAGTYASTVTSKAFTGKAAGTYRYKTEQCITVFSATSCWDAAGPVSVTVRAAPTPASPPATPAKPTVTAGNTYLAVSWTAPADNGSAITRYSMHYKASGATAWTTHPLGNAGTATRTTITGLTNGTTYLLQVRAHNAAGVSAFSATARGTPVGAGSLTVSPTTSTDGDYTVNWTGARCFRIPFGGGTLCRVLQERVGRNGSWTAVSGIATTATSEAFKDKTAGTYWYRLLIGTAVVDGPVSVTVGTPPTPTASMSWSPASVAYGASSTLSWSSTHATACYLNGTKRSTRGVWLAKDRTVTRTDNLYCTGAGGTSPTVTATLTVGPAPPDLPDAPAKPALTGGVLQFTADWTAPNDNGSAITDYGLQYRLGAGAWQRTTTGSTATRATVTVAAAGTYTVHVRAKNAAGWSKFSRGATVAVTDSHPPATPAQPSGPATSTGTHTVTWKSVTGATRYRVRESDDNEKTWTVFTYQDTLSRTFKDRKAGAWDYQVQACTDTDGQCSGWSAALRITVSTPPVLTAAPNPSPDGDYTVSWTAPALAILKLRLWQQVEKSGKKAAWTVVGTYPGATTSKAFSQGSTPAIYHYKAARCITVFGVQACWGESDPVSVRVQPLTTPATPTGLAGTAADARGHYTVSWEAVSNATRYELQERDEQDEDWDNDYTISTGTSQAFTDQAPGTWTYAVRACNAATVPCSDWSDPMDVPVPKPDVPGNLTNTTPTLAGDYTVSWGAVTHATQYELQESTDGGKTWATTYTLTSGLSQAFTGQAKGTWTYRVRACRQANAACGDWSAPIDVPVDTLPPPENFSTTAPTAAGDYTLSWKAVTEATYYEVQESSDDGKTWAATYTVTTGTSQAFTNQAPGEWTYRVRACKDATRCSAWSGTLPVTVPPPGVPDNLSATAPDANGDYTVSWDTVTGAARYRLQESDDAGKTWAATYPVTTGVSKAFTNKAPGEWTYRVRACRQDNVTCGGWSDTLTVTVPGPPAQPDAPVLAPDDAQLSVTWTAPDDNGSAMTGYNVRYRADTDTDWTSHPHATTDTETVIDQLTNGLEYAVQVQAVNARGDSPWSERATATPQKQLAAPGGLTAPAKSSGDHTVSWDAVTGATRYKLQARRDGAPWMTHDTGTRTAKAFSALAAGAWDYRVRACDGQLCGPWSVTVTVTVGTPPVPHPPAPAKTKPDEVIKDTEKAKIDQTGTLPGAFRVAESGAASYRIDITLPPGSAGVVPPLALAYNSQRGNGPVGIGWGLEGPSAITRCRQTLAQDGAAQPLTLTGTDRFCLDGQRLVLSPKDKKNKVDYGAANSTYHTEIDSFLTVTVKAVQNDQPDYFEVTRKDGSVATYGAAGAHASEHKPYAKLTNTDPTNKVLTWALQQVRDSAGNRITYHYTHAATGHRLTHIRYAYGASKTVYQAEVALAYEDRPDPTTGYLAGYPLRHSKRLDTVTVRGAGHPGRTALSTALTTLRTYRLDYAAIAATDPVDTLSRLVGVKACVGASTTACLPETTFTWSAPRTGFNRSPDITTTLADSDWRVVDINPADINGDGFTDLVWTEAKGKQHRIGYALADRSGALTQGALTTRLKYLVYNEEYGDENPNERLKVHVDMVDVNADGRQDLLVYSTEAKETRLHLATPRTNRLWQLDGLGTVLFDKRYRYADLNSDGLLDAYRLEELAPARERLKAPSGYQLRVRYLTRDDNETASSARYYTYSSERAHDIVFSPQPADTTTPLLWRALRIADTALADVDGDGRADLVLWGYDSEEEFDQGGNKVNSALKRLELFRQEQTGTTTRFVPYGVTSGVDVDLATPSAPKGARIIDINQDGLSDLVYFTGQWFKRNKWSGDWYYRLSTGAGWTDAVTLLDTPDKVEAPGAPSLHDDNGDGYPDFLWHDVKAKQLKRKRYQPGTGTFAAEATVRPTKGEDEEQYLTVDMTGDGHGDLLYLYQKNSTKTLTQYHQPTPGRPHLVTSITSGLAAKTTPANKARTSITYESLSRTDAYLRIEGINTTTVMRNICDPWRPTICREAPVTVANADAFYTQLNTPWADMTLTDSLTATSGGAPVLELMGPLYVVTQVRSSAPTATDASATSGIGYVYEQGKVQAAGRGLLGFKSLTTLDLQTGVRTTTTYRQDFPYIGYPQRTEVRTNDDKLLRKAINTWQLKGHESGWNVPQPTTNLGTLQPYLAKSVERTCSLAGAQAAKQDCSLSGDADEDDDNDATGDALHTVTTKTDVDNYGNPTSITVTTDDHANSKRFQQVTANTYGAASDTWSKQFGRLTKTVVTRKRNETANNDNYDSKVTASRTATFSYYTAGKTKGLLRTETREPGDARLKHETAYRYDKFGHRVRAVVRAVADATGRTPQTRCNHDTVEYDPHGRFVTLERDCLGRERRTMTAHNGWGQPITVEQVVNASPRRVVSTTHHYTAGGALYFTQTADGHHSGRLRAACKGVTHCPTGAAYYEETRQAGGGTGRDYRDVLGRVLRTAHRGFDGTWVHTDTEYDHLGRVARQSEPYHAGKTRYWTTHTYDLLGRVTRTTLPDSGSNPSSRLTLTYQGLSAKTVNGKGQASTEFRNALGELIKTVDALDTPVTHAYDARGQVMATTTGTGKKAVTVRWAYDARGRRIKEDDPDRGVTTYAWNGFDELITQTDAVGNVQTLTYDALGRRSTRKDTAPDGEDADTRPDVESTVTWTYDGASNGLGQLSRVADSRTGYSRTHRYDSYGRAAITETTVRTGAGNKTATYYGKQTYDEYGRPHQSFDAARQREDWSDNAVEVQYNQWGYAHRWVDGVYQHNRPRAIYRTIKSQNARGQVTGQTLGGGAITTTRGIETPTGRLTTLTTRNAQYLRLQQDSYRWDVLGNLRERTWQSGNTVFDDYLSYDALSRLTKAETTRTALRTNTKDTVSIREVSYDAYGNITSKSDVGDYTYGSTRPHAVTSTYDKNTDRTETYTYDANGNQRTGAGRTLTYTAANQVRSITQGMHTTAFVYGPDRQRIRRTDTIASNNGTSTTITLYLGNVEHVIAADGSSTYKRYLAGGTVLITQRHDKTGTRTTNDTCYLLKDHLGSLVGVLDAAGMPLQRFRYDAWGQRLNPDTAEILPQLTLSSALHGHTTARGYTGHEMLDAQGIIHMNGRIYDPKLGRFLQADPIIQFPDYSQGWNRYSYVLNNPLTYTDPSGYFLKKLFRKVVGFALNGIGEILFSKVPVLRQFSTLAYCLSGNPVQCGAAAAGNAYAGGASLKRALKAGVFAYVSTEAFTAVGDYFQGIDAVGGWRHFGAHALTGGILTELQGGEFGHGFLSAGVAFGVGRIGEVQGWSEEAQFVSRVVSAGTVSEVTGGKFANGAATAAFAFVYNEAKHAGVQGEVDRRLTPEQRELARAGKVLEFWESRLESGDPIARLALKVLDNEGLGKVANDWLLGFDADADLAQIRVDIMREHARVTETDADGWLSPEDIARYHHGVFEGHGLPAQAFGGTPVTGTLWESRITRDLWCRGCAP